MSARAILPLDRAWSFLQSSTVDAHAANFDDREWRTLDLPHDWSIEGPFSETHPTGGAGGFLPSGVAWYRKRFTVPSASPGQRSFVAFDGVMEASDVWINGVHLGHRPNGYVSFRHELTAHLNRDPHVDNVLVVRADTSAQPASRWYTGAGIYRHVRLIVTDAVHLEPGSTFVSTPHITTEAARVRVQTRVENRSEISRPIRLQTEFHDPAGKIVATLRTSIEHLAAGASREFDEAVSIVQPRLWDVEQPDLYLARVQIFSGDAVLDDEDICFGFRDARFESASGFWLNGKNLKLKGACVHHDGGAFGAAVPQSIWQLRLTALKSLGVNAIRTAHNPPSPEFLDLCDRMGLLVMDELFDVWTVAKNPHDYHRSFREWSLRDVRDTVRRDRNHPSVILYSAGNEIHDTPQESLAFEILSRLVAAFHEEDPTRPVTQALFRPNVSHDYDNGLADLLDVIGTNYRDLELLAAYDAQPTRKILGTEQSHERRVWLRCRDHPPHAGQFLWCGIDYLGESRAWPNVAAASGLLDKTGAIKTMAFERAALWSQAPVLRLVRRTGYWEFAPTDPGFTPLDRKQVLFADWTPTDTAPHEETVEVYSNCADVELVFNDQSLGSKPRASDDSPRVWRIDYARGTLRAVGRNRGLPVAIDELKTAGAAARVQLIASRNVLSLNWDDVVAVSATIVDHEGIRIPDAEAKISFFTHGPGAVVAVDSEDIANHEPFQLSTRTSYQGRCVAFVRATAPTGMILVRAKTPGLADGTVELKVEATSWATTGTGALEKKAPAPEGARR